MKKFNTTANGYDCKEVNAFITEVTTEYEAMLNKLKSKENEIILLKSKLSHYQNIETTLNNAVNIAEDSSKQVRQMAQEEAKTIIEEAKRNASHIVNDALREAEQIELEADKLKRSLRIYKARIKQVVEEQLAMVDDVDQIASDYKE